ncbi:hypothetical protein [Paenibacillus rhizovicinus]|uniref:hypothetical protein n=1 Tax=Paenibacillus rhizovicinus TaxID=2704463 RepID=UPI00178422FA|nr:hypothetical protein [Paenibacillus rhizovicinus]
MRPTIEKYLPDFEQIKKIKETLKKCKDEWLEKDPKGKPVLGHNTMRQIIDHAVEGVSYWDFGIEREWREEVYKHDKVSNSYQFDGYVYHVKGWLYIAGVGQREQYGCKIAIGGKDNQNSAYKAAASDAFKKAASLFSVGEEIYSKIKVEMDDEQQYQQMMGDPNYQFQQAPQYQQQPAPYPNGQQQQWSPATDPTWTPQPQWQAQPQAYDMNPGYQQPQQQQAFGNVYQYPTGQQLPVQQQQGGWPQDVNQEANGNFDATNPNSYPFNPHNEGTPEAAEWDRVNMPNQQQPVNGQPQEQAFMAQPQGAAQPQGQAQPQGYAAQPQSYGAPVQAQQPMTPASAQEQQATQPSAVPIEWNQSELMRMHEHRGRLNIQSEEQMNSYIRDYLKNSEASMKDITPENLKGLNDYLMNIAV